MKRLLLACLCSSIFLSIHGIDLGSNYLQMLISSGPLAWMAAKHITVDSNILNTNPDASAEITAFIHELLEQHGVQDPQNITIKLGKKYCSGTSTIIIEWLSEDSSVSLLESLIYEYKKLDACADAQTAEVLLNLIFQQIGSIEHEIAHIKNSDVKKRALFLTIVSGTTYGSLKLFEYVLPLYFPKIKAIMQNSGWKSQCSYHVASGTILAIINILAVFKLDRSQERIADASISDNAAILLAKANQHAEIHESLKSYVKTRWYGEKLFSIFERFPSLYVIFDWQHPTSFERAQTFAKRLATVLNEEQIRESFTEDII